MLRPSGFDPGDRAFDPIRPVSASAYRPSGQHLRGL